MGIRKQISIFILLLILIPKKKKCPYMEKSRVSSVGIVACWMDRVPFPAALRLTLGSTIDSETVFLGLERQKRENYNLPYLVP
jgi:hypothetical protein